MHISIELWQGNPTSGWLFHLATFKTTRFLGIACGRVFIGAIVGNKHPTRIESLREEVMRLNDELTDANAKIRKLEAKGKEEK